MLLKEFYFFSNCDYFPFKVFNGVGKKKFYALFKNPTLKKVSKAELINIINNVLIKLNIRVILSRMSGIWFLQLLKINKNFSEIISKY